MRSSRRISGGLFFVALATLMYEILLTRIFSVTMWFHFAFVAISIAMFGMTVGALVVYLNPAYFSSEKALRRLAVGALGLAVTLVASFVAHLYIPFITDASFKNLFFIALTYAVISVPFVFSGICVCLALTKFPGNVGRLYAADLAGASVGCLAVAAALGVMDAPSAVFLAAVFAAIGAAFFASSAGAKKLVKTAAAVAVFFGLFAGVHAAFANQNNPIFHLVWVKGHVEGRPFYEKWNSFSRVTVGSDPNGKPAFGWGLSSRYAEREAPEERWLLIDSGAATPITAFDGDLGQLTHLKYDITNLAHYLRPRSNVLVVGTGGGRDVLSALVFNAKSVRGVEINRRIIDTVNKKYGDFSGHLDRQPGVVFVNDEARSYIARSPDKFDIIQVSFIDTNAATAAGAFVFTENSLYTIEAWKIFLQHLTPDGILTFSRWYYLDLSGEIYRIVTLAVSALKQCGIEDPRRHILLVKNIRGGDIPDVGTLLVSKRPFSGKELSIIREVSGRMNFEVVLDPQISKDPVLDTLTSGQDYRDFLRKFPINISAPTDDSPFFFSMVRPWQAFDKKLWNYKLVTFNMKAIFVLGALMLIVAVLTLLCIFIPLGLTAKRTPLEEAGPLFIYFAAIGLGFMFIEISMMQRLIVFLGHPVYGLTVVLFTLLLASSLGSYAVGRQKDSGHRRQGRTRLGLLLGVLGATGLVVVPVIERFQTAITPVRLFAAAALLAPPGVFMGMAFPLGMKAASRRAASLTPWFWGINGAASVCASVLAVVVALSVGISASYWTGFACYMGACVSFVIVGRNSKS